SDRTPRVSPVEVFRACCRLHWQFLELSWEKIASSPTHAALAEREKFDGSGSSRTLSECREWLAGGRSPRARRRDGLSLHWGRRELAPRSDRCVANRRAARRSGRRRESDDRTVSGGLAVSRTYHDVAPAARPLQSEHHGDSARNRQRHRL